VSLSSYWWVHLIMFVAFFLLGSRALMRAFPELQHRSERAGGFLLMFICYWVMIRALDSIVVFG
jgi:hypothetical protein